MWKHDWAIYGSATQEQGLFLAVAPGFSATDFALDPGFLGWLLMTVEDLDGL
jgi:hypothetical protein